MPTNYTIVQRLIIIWMVVWLAQSLGGLGGSNELLLAMRPFDLFRGDLSALPGLFLWPFSHAPFPSLSHIFFNCYLMWVFGQEVEVLYRGSKFLKLLAASTLAGLLVHVSLGALLPWAFSSPVIGGSGLVMSMLGVQAAVYPTRRLNLILFECRLISFFLVLVGLDAMWFLYAIGGQGGGIAVDVHLAGAALGYWWAGGFQHAPNWLKKWRRHQQQIQRKKNSAARQNEEKELDRILQKISEHGMPSLSQEERSFLERRSRRK